MIDCMVAMTPPRALERACLAARHELVKLFLKSLFLKSAAEAYVWAWTKG
jgi:hypothetical protein